MSDKYPESILGLATRLADISGPVIRRYFRAGVTVDDKDDRSPVTIADRAAEERIRAMIAAERPEDGIIGEEHGITAPDAEWVWVIDPIDGTKSFISGRPLFGTLIAVLRDGVPVVGVIDQPIIGDRWVGVAGQPTTHNGRPVRVRPRPEGLASAIVGTTSPDAFPGSTWDAFRRVSREAKVAIYGGDCYSYGQVASGYIDLVIEAGLKLYDFAALVPVVTGAGGIMTDWDGQPLNARSSGAVVAAGDAGVHRYALERLKEQPGG